MMPKRPTIRIMKDGYDDGPHWCGAFPEGWSSLGRVSVMPISRAIWFYLRVLKYDFPEGGMIHNHFKMNLEQQALGQFPGGLHFQQ